MTTTPLAPPTTRSLLGNEWRLRDPEPCDGLSLNELTVRLLRLRGIESRESARAFLTPALPEEMTLPNLAAAIERLAAAVRGRERIAVYGDYDADGMTATAVLVEGINDLGGVAIPYIPHRFNEGYGLNTAALSDLIGRGATLIVTVDTGTSAIDEIAYANERQTDVIVVDHHEPKPQLPDAVAVVNPHLPGVSAAHANLSGCGVAFCVLSALAERLGAPFDPVASLDLVAIGTVCDLVPLTGANRAFVALGLQQLTRRQRPGLRALIDSAGLRDDAITAHHIGFRIGPRLNAAGRLAHGLLAYELMTTRDPVRGRELAAELEAINQRRRLLTEEAVAIGRVLALECADAPLIMVGDERINMGVAGLVASRLAEEFHRPAIVYQRGAEFSTGSARSVPAHDIHATLAHGAALMERFGGHHQAGGFTARTDRMAALQVLLTAQVRQQQDSGAASRVLMVDMNLSLGPTLTARELLTLVNQLQPCGKENEAPLFLTRDALVARAWTVGAGQHLRLQLVGGARRGWGAIGFGLGEHLPLAGSRVDLVYRIERDRDGGAELHIVDLALDGTAH